MGMMFYMQLEDKLYDVLYKYVARFYTFAPGVAASKVWKTRSSKVGGFSTMYASLSLNIDKFNA